VYKYNIALTAVLLVGLQSAQVQGVDLTGHSVLGSDSNPYKLQDALDKSSGATGGAKPIRFDGTGTVLWGDH